MKIKISLIFLILVYNYYLSQNQEIIKIKEQYTPLKIYINDKVVKNNKVKKDFSYLYKLSMKKDSILYYDVSDNPLNQSLPITFTLKKSKEGNRAILSIKENETFDTLNIIFSNKLKTITINKDVYFCNDLYYSELNKSIYNANNILDLVDFLDDNLGDYPYQLNYILKISSNKKYRNNKLKILSAKIYTTRTQSESRDIWKVNYNYNKNGILISVIKKTNDGELGFEKKLIYKKATEYKYKIHKNVESRYEDNNNITFDINKDTYNVLQNHFQSGLIKEEISQLKRILYQEN
ncbi:hypothetical protein QFZ37_002370 [Chryseobacterium ginsenosidimutans]|uniref:hypothetical protein n=1 Tax=Chryseobacterium ginsenosidimutans TaxID=687846 RepID=UPI002780CCA2|nr:hypothetical protein [Chryseobacterium ginsenosidimutans]MDQ0594001.1 hypothetical protein [Chryseobacterium ginsenosidimutans]